jgi:hypothetical protein
MKAQFLVRLIISFALFHSLFSMKDNTIPSKEAIRESLATSMRTSSTANGKAQGAQARKDNNNI